MLKAGDFAVLAAGTAAVAALAWWAWLAPSALADTALVRAAGKVVHSVPLNRAQILVVSGPLGPTRIEIAPGRARVQADPSPRQLCVRQGWLVRAGDAALCLPNQVSLELRGRQSPYDTLGY
ncbi:MAG: NusG domain II-containing protein [Thiobacillus sp.]|nr:NusG domain II-containing protein [Thiobacillus sp.]